MVWPVMLYNSPVVVEQTSPMGSASPIAVVMPLPPVTTDAVPLMLPVTPLVWPEIEIERSGRRRAEIGVVGVVAHGEVLRVVPQRGHGVAVIVAHVDAGGRVRRETDAGGGRRRSGNARPTTGTGPSFRRGRPTAPACSCGSDPMVAAWERSRRNGLTAPSRWRC